MATPSYSIEPVRGLRDILAMRLIRNQCAGYMTHNPNQISLWQQLQWYFKQYYQEYEGYLVRYHGAVVGYGLIRFKGGKTWVSGGLVPGIRGRGFGRQLFSHLTQAALDFFCEEVWLDVARTNERAYKLYQSLGYQPMESSTDLIVMRYLGARA